MAGWDCLVGADVSATASEVDPIHCCWTSTAAGPVAGGVQRRRSWRAGGRAAAAAGAHQRCTHRGARAAAPAAGREAGERWRRDGRSTWLAVDAGITAARMLAASAARLYRTPAGCQLLHTSSPTHPIRPGRARRGGALPPQRSDGRRRRPGRSGAPAARPCRGRPRPCPGAVLAAQGHAPGAQPDAARPLVSCTGAAGAGDRWHGRV